MIELLTAAFVMGLLGSLHCVGMCGPLALSLPLHNHSSGARFTGALLYNLGRVITYSAMGILFGLIGKSVALFGFQQWLSLIMGILILLFIIIPKRLSTGTPNNFLFRQMDALRSKLGKLFFKQGYIPLFGIGLLNGLLPCGLVYLAAAGAVASGDLLNSVLFMAFFGLGTLPSLLTIAYFGNYIGFSFRQRIRKLYPYMISLMACLLILRGMGLGIPYISPKSDMEKKEVHSCCKKPA